jgi:hypothetical protein
MNSTIHEDLLQKDFEKWTIIFQAIMIVPEYMNFVFLLSGIYGMYRGIEIQHPLYATIFLDLMIALFFTLLDMIAFFYMSPDKFFPTTNTNSGVALHFHCTCWCVTSIIRYIYIVHENWIHKAIPNHKYQCYMAIGFTFILYLALSFPSMGYSIYLGNYFYYNFSENLF